MRVRHPALGIYDWTERVDHAIEAVAEAMKLLKAQGITLKKLNVGEPGELLTEGGNIFVVVPTSLEMEFSEGKIISNSRATYIGTRW